MKDANLKDVKLADAKFTDISGKIIDQLNSGIFLTVKDNNGSLNTMTIGWASLGRLWQKPVFIALVRPTRHTYKLIENAKDFTVSIPLNGQLKNELTVCGTKSGRDMDKFSECGLVPVQIDDLFSPAIDGCDIFLGCKIIYKQTLSPESMNQWLNKIYDEHKDYHTLYYGEILSCKTK